MTIIDKDEVKRYLNFFHKVYFCLHFDGIDEKINNLAILLALIQLRFKIFRLVKKTKNYA